MAAAEQGGKDEVGRKETTKLKKETHLCLVMC